VRKSVNVASFPVTSISSTVPYVRHLGIPTCAAMLFYAAISVLPIFNFPAQLYARSFFPILHKFFKLAGFIDGLPRICTRGYDTFSILPAVVNLILSHQMLANLLLQLSRSPLGPQYGSHRRGTLWLGLHKRDIQPDKRAAPWFRCVKTCTLILVVSAEIREWENSLKFYERDSRRSPACIPKTTHT
jgi:hypothetical protein